MPWHFNREQLDRFPLYQTENSLSSHLGQYIIWSSGLFCLRLRRVYVFLRCTLSAKLLPDLRCTIVCQATTGYTVAWLALRYSFCLVQFPAKLLPDTQWHGWLLDTVFCAVQMSTKLQHSVYPIYMFLSIRIWLFYINLDILLLFLITADHTNICIVYSVSARDLLAMVS